MESIFESIKPFGLYQKINIAVLASLALISALHFYVQVFNMAEPKFHCKPKHESNQSIEKCIMWNNFSNSQTNNTEYSCVFQDPYYNQTAINSWGLVCEKHALVFQSQTVFFFGSMCILLNGYITDRVGRKRTCTAFLLLICVINLLYQTFVVDSFTLFGFFHLEADIKFILYCAYQFTAGFLVYSLYACAYVIAVEFTTDDYHTRVANLILISFVIGELILLLVFYLTRDWVPTNWFITASTFASTIGFVWFVPESPRYTRFFFNLLQGVL